MYRVSSPKKKRLGVSYPSMHKLRRINPPGKKLTQVPISASKLTRGHSFFQARDPPFVLFIGFADLSLARLPPLSYDYTTGALSPDIAEQAEQSLRNVASALAEAGATIEDVVRVTYTVPEREAFPAVWPVLRRWFGHARPAATMISAGLMKEEMKIEIEVTAVKGSARKEGDA
ncbi:Endoribonuclease L-PSP/chorismate mutase-like protein [Xylaria palmicola]|nr:Endoribonuclease L-PSP/chorismate mutase-like protein [Xylaria palmicola]